MESVSPLESTVIAPLEPLVELIRLKVPLAPEVITLAVTPRLALLIAVARPASVAGVPPAPTSPGRAASAHRDVDAARERVARGDRRGRPHRLRGLGKGQRRL